MSKHKDDKSYEVGHGKPPKKWRYKPGQSGNTKGRPKKKTDPIRISMQAFHEFIMGEGSRRVPITDNGKTIHVPILQVIIRQLYTKAASGNIEAIKLSLRAMQFAATENDKNMHEWILEWNAMQQRILKSQANPGSLDHYDTMYCHYMFKRDIRRVEGEKTWPYENYEPITNENWTEFIKTYEDLKKAPDTIGPWPPHYAR
ncbi:MAG: DUF5681 domain-containing protein [Rickettsiales bacterium]|nr:DUF5681 domain-containing protein [Rickettsiales bacterium]